MGIPCSDGQDDLANVHTSNGTIGLSESTTHTGLQSIGTSARQHLVDTDDMVRVGADAEMETFLSGNLDEVLVGANTGGFEGLRGQLLVLVRDKVDAERELVDVGTLTAEVEDADLGIGHTTVEARLGVLQALISLQNFVFLSVITYRLVLAVPVAAGGSPGHCVEFRSCFEINKMRFLGRFRGARGVVTAIYCKYGFSRYVMTSCKTYPVFICGGGKER